MALDRDKIVAEATRYVQKGQYDKALKAYERILAEDRRDVRTLLKVGEIQQRKGDNAGAAATFNRVAEIYGEQGFFLKAVAVYKQITKITPDDVGVNEKLAGLYQQLGLLGDATTQLQAVAAAHERAGDPDKHLEVLRRLLDLDPENVVTCQRLGDLYARAGRAGEALELYRRADAHLKENRRTDEHLKLAERIFQLTPDDVALARELAREYLHRGDAKKALGKLQVCHGADKRDVETLRMMAQAFRDLGQGSKTIAVYRALARAHAEQGRRDEATATWRDVLELVPDDAEATEELAALVGGAIAAPRPVAPAPAPPPGVAPGPVTPGPTVAPAPARPRPPAAPPPAARPPPAAARPGGTAPAGPSDAPVARILAETDVYLKYGLQKKALEHVLGVLALDPENPEALERIRDLRAALGDREGAAEAAERVLRALRNRGDPARLQRARGRMQEIDPARAAAFMDLTPVPTAELPLGVIPPDEEGPRGVTETIGPVPVGDDEGPTTIEAYPQAGLIPLMDEPLDAEPPASEPLPAWPELAGEFEELEFYLGQGLREEALLALGDLEAAWPGHPDLPRLRTRLEAASSGGLPALQRGTSGVTGIFDLAGEAAATPESASGEPQISAAEVFEQFKRGLERTVRPDDAATKCDLGIAFQEMGMLDEALEQFRSALAGGAGAREAEILGMIATCLSLQGRPDEAIRSWNEALRSEHLGPEAAKAIRFDLGEAHEALGRPAEALWWYQTVARVDPAYRDVGGRIARLGGGPGVPPAESA